MSALDLPKLVKVAGLLASDRMGERSVAAAKATAILKRAGITWEEALQPRQGPRTVVLLPADTSALDAEIARLKAALAASERSRKDLLRMMEAQRNVFWIGEEGGPSVR